MESPHKTWKNNIAWSVEGWSCWNERPVDQIIPVSSAGLKEVLVLLGHWKHVSEQWSQVTLDSIAVCRVQQDKLDSIDVKHMPTVNFC